MLLKPAELSWFCRFFVYLQVKLPLRPKRPDGIWYTTLADEKGISYTYIGENGAKVSGSAEASSRINGWMNSEGHRKNMLREKHIKVGIGIYYSGQYCYVSLMRYY